MSRACNRHSFFHPNRIRASLESYARSRSRSRGWWVSEKVRLYGLAETAFQPDDPQEESFGRIYDTLRAYWQVFRNGPGWSVSHTFRVLLSPPCSSCSRERLDLLRLGRRRDVSAIWQCLRAMSAVKTLPAGNVSAMAVSKFLHFFNPTLFPIYDRAVVRNRAFPRFRGEIVASRERWRDQLRPLETDRLYNAGLGEYLHYLLWAADCVGAVDSRRSMTVFVGMFSDMLRAENAPVRAPRQLSQFFATAFEFAMVGAVAREPTG
jgi:hypothetical protein